MALLVTFQAILTPTQLKFTILLNQELLFNQSTFQMLVEMKFILFNLGG